jgi:hypothetical protein
LIGKDYAIPSLWQNWLAGLGAGYRHHVLPVFEELKRINEPQAIAVIRRLIDGGVN